MLFPTKCPLSPWTAHDTAKPGHCQASAGVAGPDCADCCWVLPGTSSASLRMLDLAVISSEGAEEHLSSWACTSAYQASGDGVTVHLRAAHCWHWLGSVGSASSNAIPMTLILHVPVHATSLQTLDQVLWGES